MGRQLRKAVSKVAAAFLGVGKVPPQVAAHRQGVCRSNRCRVYDRRNDACGACGCSIAIKPLHVGERNHLGGPVTPIKCPRGLWPVWQPPRR